MRKVFAFYARVFYQNALPVLLCTFCFSAQAKDLPVVPFPQEVVEGKTIIDLSGPFTFDYSSLDADMSDRLKPHTESLTHVSTGKRSVIHFKLLGKTEEGQNKIGDEGYIIKLTKGEKIISANTETGLFYGLQTLKQLARNHWSTELFIIDWPVLKYRAIYDDISRGPISSVAYVKQQIERLAEIKINYLSFYIEHVVQPLSHPDFAPANGKLTIAQIKELSGYAAKFHMQLIGSFQSFGHFEKILSLPQYQSMGETSTLISPLDPKAKQFISDVIGELCDAFNAPFFNINCDETFGIADGKSKRYIDSIGVPRFYADHIRFLYEIVKRHNKKLMMWGDVALQHETILDMLPKDIIYLTWEYGDQKSFDQWILPFAKRKLEFMVCPGILNSYRMFPDMVMARANIEKFLKAGEEAGSNGAITTIWDDGGTFLFSGDWYGVYVAAEKSWNRVSSTNASFNKRFELSAYGVTNNYVKALWKLMELRNVPLTYNLNDQLWNQKILPESGKALIVNNSTASLALKYLKEAEKIISTANANRNRSDINTLKYSIGQYLLMIDSRLLLAGISKNYAKINSIRDVTEMIRQLDALRGRYQQSLATFRQAWLNENQEYWLDVASKPYVQKINALNVLGEKLKTAATAQGNHMTLPDKTALGLNLILNDNYYFQNWMLGGPFPLDDSKRLPSFLYSERAAYNKPPSPGDFTHYKEKTYRWQKYASSDGGIVDLFEYYKHPVNSFSYAYCSISTSEAANVSAFVSNYAGLEIFCNGEKIISLNQKISGGEEEEKRVELTLVAGLNHVLIKCPETIANWAFTFRLDPRVRVTNHKHKYTLNPKMSMHEAE